ncbi:MarC family protein [Undibacterium sp. Rencai35W]|uniref:MarC family protein n=1 Tax=Undibacterium sp. Rencai35W TaxID=3413046 RepID=UPI003BF3E065
MSFTFSFFIVLLLVLNSMLGMSPQLIVNSQSDLLTTSGVSPGVASSPSNNQIFMACTCLLLILLLLSLFGQSFRYWVPISVANRASLQVSAGLILLLAALGMVFFSKTKKISQRTNHQANQILDPFDDKRWSLLRLFSPTAMMTVLLLSAIQPEHMQQIVAASAAATVVLTVLLVTLKNVQNYRRFALVANGFQILLGLILAVIAIDRMLTGLHLYFQH